MNTVVVGEIVCTTSTNSSIRAVSAIGREAVEQLHDLLPHGSGINYDWNGEELMGQPGAFVLRNSYDAMNEGGGYCHRYPFTVKVSIGADRKFHVDSIKGDGLNSKRQKMCCGGMLSEYLWEEMVSAVDGKACYDGYYPGYEKVDNHVHQE